MRIAIASGKGGTGKTTFATNLAVALAAQGRPVAYADCDVEEPNGHIFLQPEIYRRTPVTVWVPSVDHSLCTACGKCGEACRFSAIVVARRFHEQVLTFPKMCHSCGGCLLACPENAILEVARRIGLLEEGTAGTAFLQGTLDVGEPMAPPVIKSVLEAATKEPFVIVDAPPGTSCPVIASVTGSDAVLLVTEPTPFGLHDLEIAVEMVRALDLPIGIAINRCDVGDDSVREFCRAEGLPVLLELPESRRVAESYSRGQLAVDAVPELLPRFQVLGDALTKLAARSRPAGPSKTATRGPSHRKPGTLSRKPRPSEFSSPSQGGALRELVVISGKGGTGKTSILAAFAALAERPVLADCDVDAPDLHLLLRPEIRGTWTYSGGQPAEIAADECLGCGICVDVCRFDAISPSGASGVFEVDPIACEGCGVCVDSCPEGAIELKPDESGDWFVSSTRHGPMVHAHLGIAQETSGKLVSLLRQEARALASAENRDLLLVDASPGIGCPIIASITGADMVLVVTEPTRSALHDLDRVLELARQMQVPVGVCINKADLNPDLAKLIENRVEDLGHPVLGRVRYDPAVTRAQVQGTSLVELGDSPAAMDVRALWARVESTLGQLRGAGDSTTFVAEKSLVSNR